MESYFSIMEQAPIFSGISRQELSSLLSCLQAKQSRYGKNQWLLREGDTVTSAGLVLQGSVLVLQEDFWGNRNILAQITPGEIFAESFACAPGAVMSSGVLADSACVVLWLNIQNILTTCPTACAHHSRMIRNLLSELADKNLRFHEKITHITQRSTQEKLLSYLSAQAKLKGSASFTIGFNRQQLADYLGVERSAMCVALSKLSREGRVKFEKNRFTLL